MAETPEVPLSPYRTVGTRGRKLIGDLGNNVFEDYDVPTTPLTAVNTPLKGRLRWQFNKDFEEETDPAKKLENLSKQMADLYGFGTPAYLSEMSFTIATDRDMYGAPGTGDVAQYVNTRLTPDQAKQLGLTFLLPGPAEQPGTTSPTGLKLFAAGAGPAGAAAALAAAGGAEPGWPAGAGGGAVNAKHGAGLDLQ